MKVTAKWLKLCGSSVRGASRSSSPPPAGAATQCVAACLVATVPVADAKTKNQRPKMKINFSRFMTMCLMAIVISVTSTGCATARRIWASSKAGDYDMLGPARGSQLPDRQADVEFHWQMGVYAGGDYVSSNPQTVFRTYGDTEKPRTIISSGNYVWSSNYTNSWATPVQYTSDPGGTSGSYIEGNPRLPFIR